MITDDVEQRGPGATSVVEIGEAVALTRSEVQQDGCGPIGHSAIAISGSGGHALEEGEYPSHGGHIVEGGNEVHLRRAGIGEANFDARGDKS